MRTCGTCSICGGAVVVWDWLPHVPGTPSCSVCGAVPMEPFGPRIPMINPRYRVRRENGTIILEPIGNPLLPQPMQYFYSTSGTVVGHDGVGRSTCRVSGSGQHDPAIGVTGGTDCAKCGDRISD